MVCACLPLPPSPPALQMYSAAIGSTHKAAAVAALLRSLRARGVSNGTNGAAMLLRRLLLNRCQQAFEQDLPPGAPMTPARRCCLCAPACHRRPAARPAFQAARPAFLPQSDDCTPAPFPCPADMGQAHETKMGAVAFVGALSNAGLVPPVAMHAILTDMLPGEVGAACLLHLLPAAACAADKAMGRGCWVLYTARRISSQCP